MTSCCAILSSSSFVPPSLRRSASWAISSARDAPCLVAAFSGQRSVLAATAPLGGAEHSAVAGADRHRVVGFVFSAVGAGPPRRDDEPDRDQTRLVIAHQLLPNVPRLLELRVDDHRQRALSRAAVAPRLGVRRLRE